VRVLIVSSRFPLPPWRGNQVRTLEWLRALREQACGLVCPRADARQDERRVSGEGVALWTYRIGAPARAVAVGSALIAGRPAQEGLYASRSARRAVSTALREHRPDVAIVQMIRCGWALEQIRREAPGTPVLFDAIDAMGLHFSRAARFAPRVARPLLGLEAAASGRRERELARLADLAIAVSARDLAAIGATGGRVVPVSGRIVEARQQEARLPHVLLSGNLGYRPTELCALWFASEVWPAVLSSQPQARWVLAGARPGRAVRRLARLPGVEVHGDVDTLDPYLAEASVAIAPMASGSGVPMKVLEAWAAGVPVVAHPWTADGVDEDGRDGLVIADSPDDWRRAVVALLADSEAARQSAELGRAAWRLHYHPDRVDDKLREALRAALGRDR
jgi:glycosyltransferase involved in cell wall biosynthesis